jgi:cytosol alanyl aminopeptidase
VNALHKIVRIGALLVVSAVLGLSGCSPKPDKTTHKPGISLRGETIPQGRLPRDAVPVRYRIALRIDPKTERFSGHVEIDVNFLKPRRALFLHGLDLNVSGVTVRLKSGQSFTAHYDQVDPSGVARLIFVDRVPAGEATLIFDYDAPFDHSLEGLYKVVDRGDSYAFTQFESTDARRAFPSFDEPGFKTPFDITVIAPRGQRVIGNAPIASASPASHGFTETTFQTTHALPTYLVALAIGPLDVVDGGWVPPNAYRSKPLHIRGVTARGNGRRISYALSLTPRIVTALETYFGIGYPFQKLDVLAVPDFAAGAMENAGAVTFRERLLLIDPDAPLDQKRGSLTVQAHELAHQWFGDLVTPAWWDDIWLNESFATWMEYKASAAVLPEQNFETDTLRGGIDVMDLDELPSARQIHQPIRNLDDLGNAFDDITYSKGASVLQMFENYVGPVGWQRGIHAYLTKYARGNATAQDFIGTIAATTGHPELVAAFDDFIDRSGLPYLHVATNCTPTAFSITQDMYAPLSFEPPHRSWRVPVCIADNGARICKMDTGAILSIPLTDCANAPLPNAQGTGYYRFTLDASGWRQQVAVADKLSPAEQITLIGNLFAGLRAGRASAGDALTLVHTLAPTARWDVLKTLARRLLALRQSLPASDLPAYRAFISRNFAARFKEVGLVAKPGETPSDAFLRQYLATLMVTEARDPDAIAALSAAAHAEVVSGTPNQFASELRAEALRAALVADPAFADTLISVFEKTNEEYYRRDIVYAFAGSGDPAVIGKLLALSMAKIRIGELRYLSEYMDDEAVARETLWKFTSVNFAAMVRRRTLHGMGRTASILANGCSAADRSAADALFQARLAHVPGAQRLIAHTEESIDRCIAFRRAKGGEVSAALATAP